MDASEVTALNIANGAMGIFVVGIFLAVAAVAAYEAVSAFRRRRAQHGAGPRPAPSPLIPQVRMDWKRERAS